MGYGLSEQEDTLGIRAGTISFRTGLYRTAMVKKGSEMAEERTPLDNIMIPQNTGLGRAWEKLRADLNAMKAERDRWKKEALNLREKLVKSEANVDKICEKTKAKLAEIEELKGEIRVLTGSLQLTTSLKKRFKRRMELYKGRLDDLEDFAEDVVGDEPHEDYEKDDDGSYRAENGFDARDHYREM